MILMIDDEERAMDSYVQELKLSGYDVSFQKSVDGAMEFFLENQEQIDLLILDIMMPPGFTFKGANTKDGLRTGVLVYERIRPEAPDLLIVILTNVSDERLSERFQKERNCRYLRKEDYLPFELAQEVDQFLNPTESRG